MTIDYLLRVRVYAATPNGWKASILLKELKYPHEVKYIQLGKNEQKQDWFLKINPNGRIPAIGTLN
jgi:GSH-dependent disulfide-bond oxidoreductase